MAISEELQRRIDNLTGVKATPRGFTDRDLQREAEGNALSERDLDLAQSLLSSPNTPPLGVMDNDLRETIEALEMELLKTNDPEERDILSNMIENTAIKVNAPYRSLMEQLSMTGGEDDMMAHVRSGDINVSREMVENNPALEDMIEQAAIEVGIDPESMVYGSGIAALNESTGIEQHGFLKKLGKGLKKVVKKVAPIAAFIPGVGTALGGVLGGIGGLATRIPGIGGALGSLGSTVAGGIANLGIPGISSIAGGTAGGFGGIQKALTTKAGLFGGGPLAKLMDAPQYYAGGPGSDYVPQPSVDEIAATVPGAKTRVERLRSEGMSDEQIMQNLVQSGYAQPAQQAPQLGPFGGTLGPRLFGTGQQQQLYDAQGNPVQQRGGVLSNIFGGGQGGGLGGLASLGIAGGLAGTLGKLAYEETKKDKGVSLSPVVAMDATGRYNLEAEMARRMGQQAPNPAEFGLLPANTFPVLSGGKPREVMAAAGGGAVYPMAYAEGGTVSMEDFERMNGQINGEGTETSDDVPAMLSDGEFVMTGQAVRGAGTYDMKNNSGILTLIPSGSPSRDGGTDLMYKLMEAFSSQARPA